jgi:hypothetical protein
MSDPQVEWGGFAALAVGYFEEPYRNNPVAILP